MMMYAVVAQEPHTAPNCELSHVQMATALILEFLLSGEVSPALDSLVENRIPPYLVPVELVERILRQATMGTTQMQQVHLACDLGSAMPVHVDPEAGEIGFRLNLLIFDVRNIQHVGHSPNYFHHYTQHRLISSMPFLTLLCSPLEFPTV